MTDENTWTISADDPAELRGLAADAAAVTLLTLARTCEQLVQRLAARDEQIRELSAANLMLRDAMDAMIHDDDDDEPETAERAN